MDKYHKWIQEGIGNYMEGDEGDRQKDPEDKNKEYVTRIWLEGMDQKPVLRYYRLGQQNIEYENYYRNNGYSAFLSKERTYFLQLEEHLGRGKINYNTT